MKNGKKEGGKQLIKNTVGGVIGNALEWYDFAVFGYFAPVIGAQFFPSEDKLAELINVFGVFAAGYLMRPLGGMLFGYIGDKLGRKKALELSVLLMAIPTTLVGLLPTYAQVGVFAAVLLVVLRLAQGVSVGGELIGSIAFITEVAPPKRRGYFGSWTLFSAVGGIMLGSLVAAIMHGLMSAESLKSWGWRVPFLLGIGIGGFSFWMRTGLTETEKFEKSKKEGGTVKNPVIDVIKEMPGTILHLAAIVILLGGGFYMLFVWMPTYLSQIVKPHVPQVFGGATPLVCTWLIKATGDIAAPAYYLVAMSVASMIAALTIKDRHGEPLQ